MPPVAGLLCTIGMAFVVSGQATSGGVSVRALAERETEVVQDGRRIVKLAPVTRVVPGDQVIYTLEIRNTARSALPQPVVTFPIPAHMKYVADSASGPGAELTFSCDGGHEFASAENLREPFTGQRVPPTAYTHIRWRLKATLKPSSLAFARFRTVVK